MMLVDGDKNMTNDNGNCLIDGCTNCTSCFEIHKEILI